MEWVIPFEQFQVGRVQFSPIIHGAKPHVNIGYQDGELKFSTVTFLLPAATVRSYDASSGRLVVGLPAGAPAAAKLLAFQEFLLGAVQARLTEWFGNTGATIKREEVRGGFQPLVEGSNLHLYCPLSGQSDLRIWKGGEWHTVRAEDFAAGAALRLVLRIQGISFHCIPGTTEWSGKFRIQHRVAAAYLG